MRGINIKDALIGALMTALLFTLIAAGGNKPDQEEIAVGFSDVGENAACLITDKGTVILVKAKGGVIRGEWRTVEVKDLSTSNLKNLLAR